MVLKPEPLSEAKTGFFHYEPLSASSFRKNLSILGAIYFQKANFLQKIEISVRIKDEF